MFRYIIEASSSSDDAVVSLSWTVFAVILGRERTEVPTDTTIAPRDISSSPLGCLACHTELSGAGKVSQAAELASRVCNEDLERNDA
jgi:hypothetical protein